MSVKALTYGKLLEQLQQLTPAQLKKPVTVYDLDQDELSELHELCIKGHEDPQDCRPEDGVLQKEHPYLVKIYG